MERIGTVVLGLSSKDRDKLYDVRYLIESFVQENLAKQLPSVAKYRINNVVVSALIR